MKRLSALVIIALLFSSALYTFWRESGFVAGFVEVSAEVVELRSRRVTQGDGRQYSADAHAMVAYRIAGHEHRFPTQFSGLPKWCKGQTVTALVSPTEPGVGRVKRLDDLHPRSALLAGLGLLCVIALSPDVLMGRRALPASPGSWPDD